MPVFPWHIFFMLESIQVLKFQVIEFDTYNYNNGIKIIFQNSSGWFGWFVQAFIMVEDGTGNR